MIELAENTSEVIDTVSAQLPADFPGEVVESIFNGLKKSSERLSEID